jgi:hypothetical protein
MLDLAVDLEIDISRMAETIKRFPLIYQSCPKLDKVDILKQSAWVDYHPFGRRKKY